MSNVNSFAALDDDFVAPKPTVAKYVPPSQRKEQQKKDEADGKIDLKSNELFPTLGGAVAKTNTGASEGTKSFKQKIDDLIAFEQLTEAEKLEREEEARKMEGFVVLSIPKTAEARRELCESFNTMITQQTDDPDVLYHSMQNPPQWKPNAAPLTTSKLHKVIEEYEDYSDQEGDDFEGDDIHCVHRDWTVDCA